MMTADQHFPTTGISNEYDDDDASFASSAAEQLENFMINLCNLGQYVTFESDPYVMRKIVHTNPLSDAISRHDWQEAKKILTSKPSLAKATSSCDGMIPLHQALDAGAPEKIIKKLLEAYPRAAHTKCGEQNRLPIHYHLASKATAPSDSIASLLVDSFPESTRAGDANNQFPIHLACQATQVSEHIFALLLTSYPEGAIVRDIHGNYPCDYANWNEDAVTKEIALAALVQNDIISSSARRRNSQEIGGKFLSNPRIFDEPLASARTQKRKRLQNENFSMLNESFSMMTEYDELHQ
mmetsp:Transcript_18454/g.30175  ORF Transcript_18454/g.30175 Transcript_18454/m.30175 type:complete len:296 (-) Transcript_18454:90-977(-)